MEKKEISYKRLIVVVVIGTIVIEVFGGGGFFRIAQNVFADISIFAIVAVALSDTRFI